MRSRMLAIVGLATGIFHQSSAQVAAENRQKVPLSSDGLHCHDLCRAPHIAVVGYTIQGCRCDETGVNNDVKLDMVRRQFPTAGGTTLVLPNGKTLTLPGSTEATTASDSPATSRTPEAATSTDPTGDITTSLTAGAVITSTDSYSTTATPQSTSGSSSSSQSNDGAPLTDSTKGAALNQAASIGIGVGVGVGVAILIGVIAAVCIARRRRARARHEALVGGKYEGHAPSESSMVEARDIPTSGLPSAAYMKQPLSQTTGYYESAVPYDAHQQPGPAMERYVDHVDGYNPPPGGIVAPAAMITPTPSSPVSAIAAPTGSATPPNADRRPPSMAAIREDNPQTYQPTLSQPPQPPPTRQPTGVPLPVLQIPSPRDDERTPLASRQGTPMRSRSGSISPVSPVSPMTPDDERPASLRGHT